MIDKISAKVLKWAGPVFFKSLMQIFNWSVVSHVFPTEWKVARLNALHKKGPRNIVCSNFWNIKSYSSCKASVDIMLI